MENGKIKIASLLVNNEKYPIGITSNPQFHWTNSSEKELSVEVYDCLGELKSKQCYNVALIKLEVPMAGCCKIKS